MQIAKRAWVKYVLFDLDGTLSDTSEGIYKGLDHATDALSLPRFEREDLPNFIGPPLKESFLVRGFSEELAEQAVREFRAYYNETGKFECKPYPGIREALAALRAAGAILYVATSKPTAFAVDVLTHLGLAEMFAEIVGSGQGREEKKLVIRYILEHTPITDLDDVVMVGDKHHDVDGARACGVRSVGVAYGFGSREELAGAEAILDSPEEIVRYLTAEKKTPAARALKEKETW